MSSGTVEAADACSESSIELSSIGKVKANSTGTGSVTVSLGSDRSDRVVTFGRSHLPLPCDRGSILDFADLCSARILWGCRAIDSCCVWKLLTSNLDSDDDDDDNSDDDDVSDDNDGDNVAGDDVGAKAELNDVNCAAAPKKNTS